MADISVLNTDSDLSAQTLLTAEGSHTVTGAQTFDRDPNPPFVVTSGSAVVTNLDADKVDGKHSTDLLLLDGTQSMSAALNLGSTGQVVFPASQNASAGANTLDDYEEGTWTPAVTSSGGGSGTYAAQLGTYIKIGKMVHASGRITLTSKAGFTAGNVTLTGLPFTGQNTAGMAYAAPITYWANMTTTVAHMGGFLSANTAAINVAHATAGTATLTTTTIADLANTTDLIFSISYPATQ